MNGVDSIYFFGRLRVQPQCSFLLVTSQPASCQGQRARHVQAQGNLRVPAELARTMCLCVQTACDTDLHTNGQPSTIIPCPAVYLSASVGSTAAQKAHRTCIFYKLTLRHHALGPTEDNNASCDPTTDVRSFINANYAQNCRYSSVRSRIWKLHSNQERAKTTVLVRTFSHGELTSNEAKSRL